MSLPLMVHDEQWHDRFTENEHDRLVDAALAPSA